MKFYCLNNSETGYCLKLLICSHKNSLENTIFNLLRDHFGFWHVLYVDNFYNSVDLAEKLYTKQVYLMGTIRYNRGGPKELKNIAKEMIKSRKKYLKKETR